MGKKTNGAKPVAKLHPAHIGSIGPHFERGEPDRHIGARTLGPVSDLERHLPSDWWRTLFNSLYLETDGDIIENDRNTADEVDLLIRSVGLERNDRILDLCCGQGRHSLELASRGFPNVTGLDRSRYLIRLARKRAKQRNLQVSFHEGDARRFRLGDGEFHCVCILGNSFGYFERPEDDLAVLEAVNRALASGGSLVMDLMDGDWMRHHFEPRSWEWVDQNHFVCRERDLAGDGDRLISREVVVHAERGVIADQFYAERLYSKERLEALLTGAGFTNVRFHSLLAPDSHRNQDLGMVAHRLFVTCEAPRRARRLPHRAALFSEVTVILGDPRLPDPVKRDGRYNEEDIETIDRLKTALRELPDYRFRFLDNHASLFADLRASRPHFALNFCDEGFNNDAFMEMHVPALLEMLDIPYSGAGPSCLGLCYNKSLVARHCPSDRCAGAGGDLFQLGRSGGDDPVGVPGIDQAELRRLVDRHHQGRGGPYLGRGDYPPRQAARTNAGLPDPDPGIPDRSRIFDRDHRQPGTRLPRIAAARSRLLPARPGAAATAALRIRNGSRLALLVADRLSRGAARRRGAPQDRSITRTSCSSGSAAATTPGSISAPMPRARSGCSRSIRTPAGAGTASSI